MTANRDPIFVHCEGSEFPTHHVQDMHLCSMCGNDVAVSGLDAVADDHERMDILTMLDRGDFDDR